ncbi:MAG: DUF2064 domain-containing protein [Coriobacteriia bacterium]|nr:DUF2064 domain-containing protein [Coriobacteriia bacterium]
MNQKKEALLIFSKPPLPGLVKTRLVATTKFTDEQVADFYSRCLYDVSDLSMQALMELQQENDELVAADPDATKIQYDFFVSTTPASNVEEMKKTFEKIGPWPLEVHYLCDSGANFDEHFNDAFQQIFDMGYESIVSVGGDLPTMPKEHIKQAFRWLEYFNDLGTPGFVQAPCQECGTSLVGYSKDTDIDHTDVYYNVNGRAALDVYVENLAEKNIPNVYLSPIADIDEAQDLAHAVSCMRAIEQAAKYQHDLFVPHRSIQWIDYYNIRAVTPPNANHDPRNYIDE